MTGPDVSRETDARLQLYAAEIRRWNRAINLVAPSTLADLGNRHIADSLQLVPLIPETGVLVDLGSGAGLPGLVLAIARPELNVHLVESVGKKATFLRRVSSQLSLPNVEVHHDRIENVVEHVGAVDCVSARALASLDRLLAYAEPMLNASTICIFPKGASHWDEIAEARKGWTFYVDNVPSTTDPDAAILRVAGISRKVA